MAIAPQTIFRGTDAEIYMEGEWQTNVTAVEASVEVNQAEINLLGNYWTQYRNMSLAGSGTLTGVFVTTTLLEKVSEIQEKATEYRTEIVIKNTNADSGKTYRVRLKNVLFSAWPLGNFTAGEIAETEFSFTFAGYEILDKVE